MTQRRPLYLFLLPLLLASLAHAAPDTLPPAPPAATHTYDLCARAINAPEAEPLLETLHVRLAIQGPQVKPDLRKLVHAKLLQALLWPEQKVLVYLENYDTNLCAAGGPGVSEVELSMTQAEVDTIENNATRGVADLPGMTTLLQKTKWRQDTKWKQDTIRMEEAEGEKAGALVLSILDCLKDVKPRHCRRVNNKLWLQVWYATNRKVNGGLPTQAAFTNQVSTSIAYGSVEVGVKKQPRMKKLETAAAVRFEQVTALGDFSVAGQWKPLSHQQWLAEITQRASSHERPGVLLYIHGFNNSFVEAANRAGQLTYDLAFPGQTVFFSWPSQASLLAYEEDGKHAERSAAALATLLDELTRLQQSGPVYVVAHSMGNRVLLEGLAQMLTRARSEQRRNIASVVMAAPDVPQTTFQTRYADMLVAKGLQLTLYASSHDHALDASYVKNRTRPLGLGGRDMLTLPLQFEAIDASNVSNDIGLNHAYYGDNNSVVSDLFYLIRKRLPAEQRPNLQPNPALEKSWVFRTPQANAKPVLN